MKRLSTFVVTVVVGFCFLFSLRAADEKKITVVDYYLRLPDKTFEGSAADWLEFLKQPKCDVRPLLALCQGELAGANSLFLDFFEIGSDGKMHKTRRAIFPVKDAGNDEGNWRFELPRQGRTVLLRNQKSGKVLHKFTWNGEKFVEQRDDASN